MVAINSILIPTVWCVDLNQDSNHTCLQSFNIHSARVSSISATYSEIPGSDLGSDTTILSEVTTYFAQSLLENAAIESRRFPATSFQIH